MKKFDLKGVKGVFSTLRGGDKPPKTENEIQESLTEKDFVYSKLMRQGFPYKPTCIAWDPIQKLLAIGTQYGEVRLLGRPGVERTLQHDPEPISDSTPASKMKPVSVIKILFLVNEGGLLTICSNHSVNLWNYRQQQPEIVNTLQFSRER